MCDLISIGDRIRALREAKNLTQMDLAKELGVERSTLAKWETGRQDLKTEAVIKIAELFDVDCDFLLRGVGANNAKINKDTGLSDKAINILIDLKNRQGEPGYETFISTIIIEFFNLLIENIEFNKGHMFSLASQSIDYIVGLHEQLLFQKEIERHDAKMSKHKEYVALAFDARNVNLAFHAYQLTKHFESLILHFSEDTDISKKIKKIYEKNCCLLPQYTDRRFENVLSWRIKTPEIYDLHTYENEKWLETFKKNLEEYQPTDILETPVNNDEDSQDS